MTAQIISLETAYSRVHVTHISRKGLQDMAIQTLQEINEEIEFEIEQLRMLIADKEDQQQRNIDMMEEITCQKR